jgi:exodeoxyribonuclease VII large subunit
MHHALTNQHSRLARSLGRLEQRSPSTGLREAQHRLRNSSETLQRAFERQLNARRQRLAIAAHKLDAISPLATLQRGYAIVTDAQGRVLTDARTLTAGDLVQARLATGRLQARIERTEE